MQVTVIIKKEENGINCCTTLDKYLVDGTISDGFITALKDVVRLLEMQRVGAAWGHGQNIKVYPAK